jgi:hypothetical protein
MPISMRGARLFLGARGLTWQGICVMYIDRDKFQQHATRGEKWVTLGWIPADGGLTRGL